MVSLLVIILITNQMQKHAKIVMHAFQFESHHKITPARVCLSFSKCMLKVKNICMCCNFNTCNSMLNVFKVTKRHQKGVDRWRQLTWFFIESFSLLFLNFCPDTSKSALCFTFLHFTLLIFLINSYAISRKIKLPSLATKLTQFLQDIFPRFGIR